VDLFAVSTLFKNILAEIDAHIPFPSKAALPRAIPRRGFVWQIRTPVSGIAKAQCAVTRHAVMRRAEPAARVDSGPWKPMKF